MSLRLTNTKGLPMDIVGKILGYCNAKTIHSFLFAAIASNRERQKVFHVVLAVIKQRLLLVCDYLNRIPNYMPSLLSPYITQYVAMLQQDLPYDTIPAISFLSSRLAVLAYLEEARQSQTIHDGAHEWLVWSGTLELVYIKGETKASAHYRANSKVVRHVHVEITSPCWYPSLISKWSTSMQQYTCFGTDFSRQYRAGNQHGRRWTHVARILPFTWKDAEILSAFNQNRRHGDHVNPTDRQVHDDEVSIQPFLTSPHDAFHSKLARTSSGNVKASLVGPITTAKADTTLFAFWHDMNEMDRERSFDDFTNDIVHMLSKRLKTIK